MIKCSTEAYAKCQEHCHHCKTPDEAYFLEGSDCDKFNQQINNPPLTNADRIRAMNDEEFSCFLALVENRKTGKTTFDDTSDFWLKWLKQPAEDHQ